MTDFFLKYSSKKNYSVKNSNKNCVWTINAFCRVILQVGVALVFSCSESFVPSCREREFLCEIVEISRLFLRLKNLVFRVKMMRKRNKEREGEKS